MGKGITEMYTVLQVENISELENLVSCDCNEIRIGSEFCENKIISLPRIKECVKKINNAGKKISIIYPRLSNQYMDKVNEHLDILNHLQQCDRLDVIANDLGVLNWLKKNKPQKIKVYMGRQLFSTPGRARPPMPKIMGKENLLSKYAAKQLFNKTSLNYKLTIRFLKRERVSGIEVDYIPATFPQLNIFIRNKLKINIHVSNILVALTRKCHTARHFNKDAANCGCICFKSKLKIFNDQLGPLYLFGNAVCDYRPVQENDFKHLKNKAKYKLIIDYNWVNNLKNVQGVNVFIDFLKKVYHGKH